MSPVSKTPKKAAPKKKVAARKPAPAKSAAKRKPAPKPTAKAAAKPAAKKAAPKKTAPKKAAPKKPAPKKAPAKKPALASGKKAAPVKKAVARKSPPKTAAPKSGAKKTPPTTKKPVTNKKTTAKPAPAKKAEKPAASKLTSPKPVDAKKKAPKVLPASARKLLKGKSEEASDAKTRLRQEQMDKLLAMRGVKKPAPAPAPVKAAPASKPAPEPPPPPPTRAPKKRRKAPYTKSEVNELRSVLIADRQRLLHDIDIIDDNLSSNKETPNLTFSSHQADAATDASSMETSLIQRRYEENRLAEVTEALIKLDQGIYGLCEFCTHEEQKLCESCPWIPIERLKAKPFAKMCIQIRRLKEKNRL